MTIPLRQLGAGPEPAQNPPQPVRDWLTAAITAAVVTGCPDCRDLRPCPPHAADAVLNACRQEQLFIVPAADADAIIAAARNDHVRR
ncbi:hypothetical protein [Actinoplanes sp. NPDC049316]|uniref:hypothetical protein n=1 Tax=Actinoplanes sp. NPDC049316 TaxID=3154727 RepID=UPI0034164205